MNGLKTTVGSFLLILNNKKTFTASFAKASGCGDFYLYVFVKMAFLGNS